MKRVALLWQQYGPYHIDRARAVAERLAGDAEVTCLQVAPRSGIYGWDATTAIEGARLITMFPDRQAESVGRVELARAIALTCRDHDLLVSGFMASDLPHAVAAAWLRRQGCRVAIGSDSKADDYRRNALAEWAKQFLMRAYDAAIVAGSRSRAYYRGLGFADDRLLPGYDTIDIARFAAFADDAEPSAFEDRPFLFVGRLVAKKDVATLLRAFAGYAKSGQRNLVIVGTGPLEAELRDLATELGIGERVEWRGFLDRAAIARAMAQACALVLPSIEEQWGLVVNEACAIGLPSVATAQVGACDLLVRDGESGRVVESGNTDQLARALEWVGADEARWQSLSRAARDRAPLGDVTHFADTVEALLFPDRPEPRQRLAQLESRFA